VYLVVVGQLLGHLLDITALSELEAQEFCDTRINIDLILIRDHSFHLDSPGQSISWKEQVFIMICTLSVYLPHLQLRSENHFRITHFKHLCKKACQLLFIS
jgi:hypothetical protein